MQNVFIECFVIPNGSKIHTSIDLML